MQLTIPITEVRNVNQLLRHYATRSGGSSPWYPYDAHDPQVISLRLAELGSDTMRTFKEIERGPYVAAVYGQLQRWGAGQNALAAVKNLGHPETYAVVTGQQAGLFGGPLYSVYKALHIIKLARQLAEAHPDKRFVPMFWISTGDSDFDEVRSFHTLNRQGEVTTVALPPEVETEQGRLILERDVSATLPTALAELKDVLPGGEYREEVLAALRADYRDGNLVDGFARWMLRLFKGTELVLVDPQDPVLAQAAKRLIVKELKDGAACEELLLARNQQLEQAGYPLQVDHLVEDTELFLIDPTGKREKIARAGEGFVLRQSGKEIGAVELLTIARVAPERFVLGVMLRPVYQNTLFPVAAWVGGGAEIAYRAQGNAIFDFHTQKMAPAFFRFNATLLPQKSQELCDELGLELTDLHQLPQDLAGKVMAAQRSAEVAGALRAYRATLDQAEQELKAVAVALDPSLGQTFDTLHGNLERHVDKLEKKVTSSMKKQHEQLLRRLAQVQAQVYPAQAPQERVLGIAGFLARYGFGLVDRLLEVTTHPAWDHKVVVLD